MSAVEKLRDRLAHSQDIIAGSSLTEVIDLLTYLEDLQKQCEQKKDVSEVSV